MSSTSFVQMLSLELKMMDKVVDSQYKLEDGDKIIAEIVDEASKRLFTMAMEFAKQSEQTALDAKYCTTDEKDKLTERATELGYKANLILGIFWANIKDEFRLWGKEYLTIKQGWQIVEYTPQMPNFGRAIQL